MKKITVIMPAYNSEKTIKKSINSVLKQTHNNIELIIVNDGSTDNTGAIIKDMLESDNRIHYITKKNEGVSSARNVALDHARGDFIAFIDSDDYYKKDMLETLLYYFNKFNCDLVGCNLERMINNKLFAGKTFYREGLYEKDTLEKEIYPSIISDKSLSSTVPLDIVTKIFNKNLIDKYHIRFDEELHYGEDLLFCREYFLYADSFYYLPKDNLYLYVSNESSATNSFMKNRAENLSRTLKSNNKLDVKFPQYNLYNQIFYYRVRVAISLIANIIKYMRGTKYEILHELNLIVNNRLVAEACHKVDFSSFGFFKKVIYILIKKQKVKLFYFTTKVYKKK